MCFKTAFDKKKTTTEKTSFEMILSQMARCLRKIITCIRILSWKQLSLTLTWFKQQRNVQEDWRAKLINCKPKREYYNISMRKVQWKSRGRRDWFWVGWVFIPLDRRSVICTKCYLCLITIWIYGLSSLLDWSSLIGTAPCRKQK